MPYLSEIDLTTVTEFRQHYQPEEGDLALQEDEPQLDQQPPRHWLLDTNYGRSMLKAQLRVCEPDLVVPQWQVAPELDAKLDAMIDVLGLRDWAQPQTMSEKMRYLKFVMLTEAALEDGDELPALPFDLADGRPN